MFRKKITKSKSFNGCEDLQFSCTVRFLDEAEPLTVSFQVSLMPVYMAGGMKSFT